jgi:hypothetical protein
MLRKSAKSWIWQSKWSAYDWIEWFWRSAYSGRCSFFGWLCRYFFIETYKLLFHKFLQLWDPAPVEPCILHDWFYDDGWRYQLHVRNRSVWWNRNQWNRDWGMGGASTPTKSGYTLLPMMWNVWKIWNACWVIYHKVKRKHKFTVWTNDEFVPN